ncbi:MAG: PIG-L deacetylase family protein [Nanoarchaeota archaeon]|nr:PIG-L deacetylase family protein [Nanoarchaeota archaeon]
MNILIVGAHPDDYELGMAGTIKKHSSEGNNVFSIIMSNGEVIGNQKKRVLETKKSAEFLGIKQTYFFNFKDTKISSGIESIAKIEKITKKHNIDRIYTHSLKDRHQDHRNTCMAVLSASRKVKQILFFESPSSDVDFRPTFFVDISKYLKDKVESLRLYKSLLKLKKRYLELKAIKDGASFRGYQSSLESAESFEVFRFIEK